MDTDSIPEEEKRRVKLIVVLLVGPPGSGKSTFCNHVMRASSRPWVRICQDTINNGKLGTRAQCLKNAARALKDEKSVFIDRCNLDRDQRAEFVKLAVSGIDVHAVVLDLPAQVCISRSVKRTAHEGNLQGGKAAAVINQMLQKKELPKLSEGLARITFCQNNSDVQDAICAYSALGPTETLPGGYFGQKSPDAKTQLGILKFLKKLDGPAYPRPDLCCPEGSLSNHITQEMQTRPEGVGHASLLSGTHLDLKDRKHLAAESVGAAVALNSIGDCAAFDNAPTLAFPSISTADFQFDLEKASEIIVETVLEYANKLRNFRLVLVDLTHKSKILSLVKAKAAQKNINSNKFFTFVGDITRLFSEGGLHCNVIANAANWRLKPGGGGVNEAIFTAAGPMLEAATKEQAKSLTPGRALVVPLPSTSPLFSREGVTHVIHVLGPNMNGQRPNCLNNNYDEGCKVLKEAYSSLFEGFLSIIFRTELMSAQRNGKKLRTDQPELQGHNDKFQENGLSSDQKTKGAIIYEAEKNQKCKGYSKYKVGLVDADSQGGKEHQDLECDGGAAKGWDIWAQSLYHIAMHPERHENDVLESFCDVAVVINDLYPKAKRHVLVLARMEGLDHLADVHQEHLQLLKIIHETGIRWAENFLQDDASLIFRLGYHSAPSMRQLHLHVISQDFDSVHLKHKKHWNSFNTAFFRDSADVIEEVSRNGKATLRDDESLLSAELRCHRCRSAHPNMPCLKLHIRKCQAPFPPPLLQNDRLVQAPTKASANP
ncbi:hypothetical protein Nepgr_012052 [Nepenthes gracilis]|uniref:Macro domain-containing protein n=1 Tax=Nepenthes gracilis TaxID=150966 RepID=A0AAD3SGU5_NEPGR|nr:hypothetical protein Nepgr_012052 [Nepenthes gracilis]